MPGTNDFKAFASGGGANALTPAAYATLTSLLANGFQAGTASSAQINTVLRQVTSMAAALGKIVSDAELNAIDDGNVAVLASRILQAIVAAHPVGAQARAWVTFNASGSILASRNVTSVTRNSVGTYTVAFSAGTFSSAEYVAAGMCGAPNGVTPTTGPSALGVDNYLSFGFSGEVVVKTTSAFKCYSINKDTQSREDADRICLAFFGE